jgi:hypothetical protein
MPTKTMPGCLKQMPTPWQVAAAAQLRESRVERSAEHCAACSACCRQVFPCIDTHQCPRYPQCTPTPLTLAISGPNKQASNTSNFQTPITGTAHKSAVTFHYKRPSQGLVDLNFCSYTCVHRLTDIPTTSTHTPYDALEKVHNSLHNVACLSHVKCTKQLRQHTNTQSNTINLSPIALKAATCMI